MSNNIVYKTTPKISWLMLTLYFVFLIALLCTFIHIKWALILIILWLPVLIQIPIRYSIFNDRIEIKCLLKTWRIFYSGILNVTPCNSSAVFRGPSIKPLLSFKNLVWIERSKGMPFIISPKDRDKFIKNLNNAITEHKIK